MKVVCVDNNAFIGMDRGPDDRPILRTGRAGEKAHLTPGRTYEFLGEEHGMYRVVDNSGEDFLYPPRMFRVLDE